MLADIEGRFGPSDLPLAGRRGEGLAPALVFEPSELGLDRVIAGGDLRLLELDELHGLTELEVLWARERPNSYEPHIARGVRH